MTVPAFNPSTTTTDEPSNTTTTPDEPSNDSTPPSPSQTEVASGQTKTIVDGWLLDLAIGTAAFALIVG